MSVCACQMPDSAGGCFSLFLLLRSLTPLSLFFGTFYLSSKSSFLHQFVPFANHAAREGDERADDNSCCNCLCIITLSRRTHGPGMLLQTQKRSDRREKTEKKSGGGREGKEGRVRRRPAVSLSPLSPGLRLRTCLLSVSPRELRQGLGSRDCMQVNNNCVWQPVCLLTKYWVTRLQRKGFLFPSACMMNAFSRWKNALTPVPPSIPSRYVFVPRVSCRLHS